VVSVFSVSSIREQAGLQNNSEYDVSSNTISIKTGKRCAIKFQEYSITNLAQQIETD
jgi:hypothetical protein